MKRIFKTLSTTFVLGIVLLSAQSCTGSKAKNETSEKSAEAAACCETKEATACCDANEAVAASTDVEVFYFHATRRCATCQSVESVTEEALKEYYGTTVTFQTINREEDKDHPMIAQHEISGQSLLIVKGDEVINMTNDAFMNARTNPDKFKAKLKSAIDSLM